MRYALLATTLLLAPVGCSTTLGQRAGEGFPVLVDNVLQNPTIPGAAGALVEYLLYALGGTAAAGGGYFVLKQRRAAAKAREDEETEDGGPLP